MEFEIKRTSTNEYFNGNIPFDLNDLEKFIASKLISIDFGKSVVKYFWGFELYRFNGRFADFYSNDVESWKYSRKWLVTNSRFDWDMVKELNNEGFFKLIHFEMIQSISRVNNMKRKPKDFDYISFRETVDNILNEY
jgi:hypothetical protein